MAKDSGTDVVTFPYVNTAEVITLATILPIVCLTVVGLRFYTRFSKGYDLGLDDYLMLPGTLLYVGMCICMLIGAANNVIGNESGDKSDPKLANYLVPQNNLFAKLFFAFQIMLTIAFGFVKCSILALYRRIFVSEKNSVFDIICKIMTAIVIGWSITFFVIVCLVCGPSPWAYWGTVDEKATCATFTPTRGLAGTDMVIDVLLMVLPQPLIWRLRLSTGKKLAISILIALGCSCIGADVAQTILFGQIQKASEMDIPLDQNEIISLVMYYTCIDGGLAVTAACLVTLRPLFRNTSVQSIVRNVMTPFSSTSSGSKRSNKVWAFGKSVNSTESTESSSGTQTDVEKAQKPTFSVDVKEVQPSPTSPIKRGSDSRIALATQETSHPSNKVQSFDYFVREMRVPIPAPRGSGSIALSTKRCSNCGHGASGPGIDDINKHRECPE